MAKQCEICGKGKQNGNLVSHSNVKTHRRWEPNLRSVRAAIGGVPRRIRVCTRCLRSGRVQRPA
ncbi:MAG: 50S ribosomal protein L28 [Firmicutes bacterium]|nr:50S ribosomal protein L28 [Bacillota bacterium]